MLWRWIHIVISGPCGDKIGHGIGGCGGERPAGGGVGRGVEGGFVEFWGGGMGQGVRDGKADELFERLGLKRVEEKRYRGVWFD